MVDVVKSHIPSQWHSVVSAWQQVAEHCHRDNMWPSIILKQNFNQDWTHAKGKGFTILYMFMITCI